jgi:hypothetical protein
MYPGEYPQPLPRVTNVQCPVIAGYTTARLRAQSSQNGDLFGGASNEDHTTAITIENAGLSTVTVQLKETDDRSPSGIRTNLGTAQTVVPTGRQTVTVIPSKKFMEVTSTSGDGFVRMQLQSKIRWDLLAFAKNDPFYPSVLWQPAGLPPV